MIKLLRDRFPQCSVIADRENGNNDSNNLRYATIDEKYKCCNNYCKDYNDKCNAYCRKGENQLKNQSNTDSEKCLNSCYVITDLCTKNCESSRYNFNDRIYDKCLLEANCADNDDYEYDIECLKKNKDKIFSCCVGSCTPTDDMSCSEHCNTSYDIHYNRAIRNMEYLKFLEGGEETSDVSSRSKGNFSPNFHREIKPITSDSGIRVYGIPFVLFIFIVIILLWKKFSKR